MSHLQKSVAITLPFGPGLGFVATARGSKTVRLPPSLSEPAVVWREAIRRTLMAMVMRRSPVVALGGAADAWAWKDRGGIGCWWQLNASEYPGSCGWSSLQFDRSSFPTLFELPVGLQKCISSLE